VNRAQGCRTGSKSPPGGVAHNRFLFSQNGGGAVVTAVHKIGAIELSGRNKMASVVGVTCVTRVAVSASVARRAPLTGRCPPPRVVRLSSSLSSQPTVLLHDGYSCAIRCSADVRSGQRALRSLQAKRGGVDNEGESEGTSVSDGVALAAGGVGVGSSLVMYWSLWTLSQTGCGLPPGPGGALGALEGVSYLAVIGLVAWSAATKVKTGQGLPAGPFALLGAAEGLAYLAVAAGLVVLVLQLTHFGYVPEAIPTPGGQCYGS